MLRKKKNRAVQRTATANSALSISSNVFAAINSISLKREAESSGVPTGWSLGLIGNPEPDTLHRARMSCWPEGFSISRLEGSRWWLRRRGYGGRTLMARSEVDRVFGRKRGRAAETGRFLQLCKCHRDTCSGGGRMRTSVQTHECVGVAGARRVVTDVLQHYDESRIEHRRRISAALNSCRTSMLAPQRGQCHSANFFAIYSEHGWRDGQQQRLGASFLLSAGLNCGS